jgi:hypothetical protein
VLKVIYKVGNTTVRLAALQKCRAGRASHLDIVVCVSLRLVEWLAQIDLLRCGLRRHENSQSQAARGEPGLPQRRCCARHGANHKKTLVSMKNGTSCRTGEQKIRMQMISSRNLRAKPAQSSAERRRHDFLYLLSHIPFFNDRGTTPCHSTRGANRVLQTEICLRYMRLACRRLRGRRCTAKNSKYSKKANERVSRLACLRPCPSLLAIRKAKLMQNPACRTPSLQLA